VILSFLCHHSLGLGQAISRHLNQVSGLVVMPALLAPLQLQISLHQDDFTEASMFLERFNGEFVASIELAELSDSTMSLFVSSLRDPSDFIDRLRIFMSGKINFDTVPTMTQICDTVECQNTSYDRALAAQVSVPRRTRRKRQNYFDSQFKPVLFTTVKPFTPSNAVISTPVRWSSLAERRTFTRTVAGRFLVSDDGYFFETSTKLLSIPNTQIRYVFWSWHHQKPDSFTIFTTTGASYLFRIPDSNHGHFIPPLHGIALPSCLFFQTVRPQVALESLELTQKWRSHTLSTFEYLMWLNLLSGRSWDDPECYPVFPLLFYTDRDGHRGIRNLSRSVGAVNPGALSSRPLLLSPFNSFDRYFFSETYSTPACVRGLTGDWPLDWHFAAVGEGESIAELTPEFFCLPEVFAGRPLPPWTASAADLVAQHAERLEGEPTIHKWIDLVWGVDQQPSSSADRSNMFDPRLSAAVWEFDIADAAEVEGLLTTRGQLPMVLFTGPHPARARSMPRPGGRPRVIPTGASAVVDFFVTGVSPESLKILTAHANDSLLLHQLPAVSAQLQVGPQVKSPALLRFMHAGDSPAFAFVPHASPVLLLYDVQTRAVQSPRDAGHVTPIAAVATGKHWVVSASIDGVVCAWSRAMARVGRLFVHRAPLSCMCLNDEFAVLVSCDITRVMVISVLPTLAAVAQIELGAVAQLVIVVAPRGYIIVFFEGGCRNFTLNGTPIREIALQYQARAVCGLAGQFAMVGTDHELAVWDAFTLEKVKRLFHSPGGISAVKYHARLALFVCVRADNGLVLITYS
jgi:hypothetical protein